MRIFAAIGQQHYADPLRWYEADIARCVVEAARLVDDGDVGKMHGLPGHGLAELVLDTKALALRHPQRLAQMWIDRPAVDAGRHEGREIPRGRKHLAGTREIEIALLLARRSDRGALVGIALDHALHPGLVQDSAIVRSAFRNERRVHPERPENAALEELADRRAIAALEHELKQHIAGMRVDPLLAGRDPCRRCP